jgi:hypothetical protein
MHVVECEFGRLVQNLRPGITWGRVTAAAGWITNNRQRGMFGLLVAAACAGREGDRRNRRNGGGRLAYVDLQTSDRWAV